MICQDCEICHKTDDDFLCLYVDRDCYDGCGYCLSHDGCKYEGD